MTENDKYLLAPGLLQVVDRDGFPKPKPSTLSIDEKVELTLSIGVECITPEELRKLYENKEFPIAYDGFEPSGRMHIAQGLLKAININKLTKSGCVFVMWIADIFAFLNNKVGSDLKKIHTLGLYFMEIWKACGMDMTNVRFLWASEEIERDSRSYWGTVMDLATKNTISRIKRCSTALGRNEGDDLKVSQLFYPCMQAVDVLYIGADICQLGNDQRKVNMLCRDYVEERNKDKKQKKRRPPIILSHEMMPGLLENQLKMSKSDPNSAIFMEDTEEDVCRKIKRAYCPPGVSEKNPVLAYIRMIVFELIDEFEIQRSEENGGNVSYKSYAEFEKDYLDGKLHPGDVKPALARELNRAIEPVRAHFKKNPEAAQLLKTVKQITSVKNKSE